jgi:excisionase family DNA binding protein
MRLLYGAREIVSELGLTPRQTYNLVERGNLPHFRSGRTIIARRDALAAWIKAKEAEAARKGQLDA